MTSDPLPATLREAVLDAARECVLLNRNTDYGPPERNFAVIARLWQVYMDSVGNRPFRPHDVAVMMILLKVSRIAESPGKMDHWTDTAGYAAAGFEAVKD